MYPPVLRLPCCSFLFCQEDLLERAALVGGELRETAEGLKVLKHEVSALRQSIRSVGVSGKFSEHADIRFLKQDFAVPGRYT